MKTTKATTKKTYRLITQKQASSILKPLRQAICACTKLIDKGQLYPEKVKEIQNIRKKMQDINARAWHIEIND